MSSDIDAFSNRVPVMKKGNSLKKERDVLKGNITMIKRVAKILKVSLDPLGMGDYVDNYSDDVQHPAAKLMLEAAKSVDDKVGGGATATLILSVALTEKAKQLIANEIHPTIIIDGYVKSADKAIEIYNNLAEKVSRNDKEQLIKIAKASMQTSLISSDSKALSEIVVNAVLQVEDDPPFQLPIAPYIDDINVEKKVGGSLRDTMIMKGIVLEKEVVYGGMPKRIEKAKIALISSALEIETTEFDAEIHIGSPDQLEEKNKMLKFMVDKITGTGASVVICQKGIDDISQHNLAQANVLAVQWVKESDMTKLSRATGANIVTNLKDLTAKKLGSADLVEERKVETDNLVFIEGCKNPRSVTILIRGGSQRVVDEADRSIHNKLMIMKEIIKKPSIVSGGGSVEFYVARKLGEWAHALPGSKQSVAEKFAQSLEAIPFTLGKNAGMDPATIREKQDEDSIWTRVDATDPKITDMSKASNVEPLSVKEQIIKSATEVALMILKTDDVIARGKSKA